MSSDPAADDWIGPYEDVLSKEVGSGLEPYMKTERAFGPYKDVLSKVRT